MDDVDPLEESLARRRWYHRVNPPALLGLMCGLAPFALSFEINDQNYVALAGGALALLLGLAGIVWAIFAKASKLVQGLTAAGVMALGVFHVAFSGFVGVGNLFGPSEDDARRMLSEDGFGEIVITSRSDAGRGFSFEAYRGGERCIGSIRIEGTGEERFETCGLPEPIERLTSRCDAGEGEACAQAAVQLRDADPVDWARATRMSSRACELGREVECFYVGVAHERGGRGLPEDLALALAMYERACEARESAGCYNAALFRLQGQGVDAADEAGGCRRARQGCDLDHAGACEVLGECYRDALGGLTQDYLQARQLFRRACDAEEDDGCVNLASLQLDGRGGPEDRPQALALYRAACGRGHRLGCRMSAKLEVEGVDPSVAAPEGAQRLDALCRERDGEACLELGVFLHGGEHLPEDRVRALALFERGCELGQRTACWDAGVYHRDGLGGAARDEARARPLIERACELGHAGACRDLGRAQ